MSNSLQNIISACLQRDPSAQKKLYNLYVDRLYYTVLRYIKDPHEVENILQETFIKIFTKLESYDSKKGAFSTWSTTIAIRESLNHLRKKKIIFEALETVYNLGNIDSTLENMDLEDLMNIIHDLPLKYKIIFNMYEIDGYSHQEISDLIDINVNTSRSYLSRAKKLLQQKIGLPVK